MSVIDSQRLRDGVAHAVSPRVGGAASLPPCTPHVPRGFSPAHRARWAALTTLAVLATAAVGVAIPRALDPLIEMARWRSEGHSSRGKMVLARIGGAKEEDVLRLAFGPAEAVLELLK